jgi:hypothetical protein
LRRPSRWSSPSNASRSSGPRRTRRAASACVSEGWPAASRGARRAALPTLPGRIRSRVARRRCGRAPSIMSSSLSPLTSAPEASTLIAYSVPGAEQLEHAGVVSRRRECEGPTLRCAEHDEPRAFAGGRRTADDHVREAIAVDVPRRNAGTEIALPLEPAHRKAPSPALHPPRTAKRAWRENRCGPRSGAGSDRQRLSVLAWGRCPGARRRMTQHDTHHGIDDAPDSFAQIAVAFDAGRRGLDRNLREQAAHELAPRRGAALLVFAFTTDVLRNRCIVGRADTDHGRDIARARVAAINRGLTHLM